MAKFIKTIHDSINFHLAKQEAGFHSPSVIDRELNLESRKYFNDLIGRYADTRKISEHLQPLMVHADVSFTAGALDLTSLSDAFEHAIGLYLDDDTEAELVEINRWIVRKAHVNKAPSESYPIARIIGNTLEILPISITDGKFEYFKGPTDCVYDFTTNVDQYIYADVTSVDWEWSKHVSERIIATVLRKFEVSVRDQDLFAYSKSELPSQ